MANLSRLKSVLTKVKAQQVYLVARAFGALPLHQVSAGFVSQTGHNRHKLSDKIMVGIRVLIGNQVFTGTDNVSGERLSTG